MSEPQVRAEAPSPTDHRDSIESAHQRPAGRRIRWLLRQVEHCLALVGLGMVVYFTCFRYTRVVSDSMKPTLQGTSWANGDQVLAERVTFRFRRPRRWEVIMFYAKDRQQVMKRVIGLPGEQVQMLRGGRIFIDGEEVSRPAELDFPPYLPYGNLMQDKPVSCGEGYYVLGDETTDSDDSRFNGPIPPSEIIGRAWLILGPDDRRGWVR